MKNADRKRRWKLLDWYGSRKSHREDPIVELETRYTIGSPYGLKHDLSIRYNYKFARYEAVPKIIMNGDPWYTRMNQHFGVPFNQIPKSAVDGYEDKIPAVLIRLHTMFVSMNGMHVPHIFRESPKKADRDMAMEEINTGRFEACADVRIVADLIKVWFRELPVPILHELTPEKIDRMIRGGSVDIEKGLLQYTSSLERSILMWLADVLVLVARFEKVNHMGIEQLAIVIAPNLFRLETANPMVAVAMSKSIVDFFLCVLQDRFALYSSRHIDNNQDVEDIRIL